MHTKIINKSNIDFSRKQRGTHHYVVLTLKKASKEVGKSLFWGLHQKILSLKEKSLSFSSQRLSVLPITIKQLSCQCQPWEKKRP